MKNTVKIPAGYQAVMPYLILNEAPKFNAFMKQVFGATEKYLQMRDSNTILHAELEIEGCTIMFADATEEYKPQTAGFFIYVNNADTTFQKAIKAGATVVSDVEDKPYGRSGGVKDPCGNTWWITSMKNPSDE